MKKVRIFSIGLLLFLFSCQEKRQGFENPKQIPQETVAAPQSAIEELPNWFNAFSEPFFVTLLDSIKQEYPSLLADVKFLDSIKGLNIDFIGMVHSPFGISVRSISDSIVNVCQSAVGQIIDTNGYLFIGTELSSIQRKINWEMFLQEQATNGSRLVLIQYGINTEPSVKLARKTFEPFIKGDDVLSRLVSKKQKPFIVGTEPTWVWLTEQVARDIDPHTISFETASKLNQFVSLLGRCRSEIALARTARQLLKDGGEKKAVILYGKNHLPDFKLLAKKYGIISMFILPKECDLVTN